MPELALGRAVRSPFWGAQRVCKKGDAKASVNKGHDCLAPGRALHSPTSTHCIKNCRGRSLGSGGIDFSVILKLFYNLLSLFVILTFTPSRYASHYYNGKANH